MPPKLYLIPNLLSYDGEENLLPSYTAHKIIDVRYFMVEGQKSAQRLLKKFKPAFPINDCVFFPLNEHTPMKDAKKFFEAVRDKDIGIISEAGCPCVADPGEAIVLWAHQRGWEIIPLVGPSSILLALMASGLNGQNFAFHGYLPKDKEKRLKKIRDLEKRSLLEQETQIFMETPYHNEQMFRDILRVCHLKTHLCVACDLTTPRQYIKTLSVREWQKVNPLIHKRPALFLILRKKEKDDF